MTLTPSETWSDREKVRVFASGSNTEVDEWLAGAEPRILLDLQGETDTIKGWGSAFFSAHLAYLSDLKLTAEEKKSYKLGDLTINFRSTSNTVKAKKFLDEYLQLVESAHAGTLHAFIAVHGEMDIDLLKTPVAEGVY